MAPVAVVASAALVLTACGSSSHKTSTSGNSGTSSTTAASSGSSGSSGSTGSTGSTGSSGSSGSTGSTGTTGSSGAIPPAKQATGSTINVGNIGTYSGPTASSQAAAQSVIQAWVKWTNAHGGVGGHVVKLYQEDDAGSATTALQDVKTLIQQDHVVAIIGEESNTDVDWASYAESTGVPVIGGESLDLPFLTNPDFFPQGSSILAGIYGIESLAKKLGPKMGFFYCAEAPQCASATPLYQGLGKATGVTIEAVNKVAETAPDYTAQCAALKASGAKSVSILAPSATVIKVHEACATQNANLPEINQDGTLTSAWLTIPSLNHTLVAEFVAPFFADSTPALKAFHDALKQYDPSLGTGIGPIASYAWDSGQLFAAAVAASKSSSVTAASVKDGLYTMKNFTTGGLTPPLTFTKGQPSSVDCYFTVGIDNGKFTTPDGLKYSCAPAADLAPLVAAIRKAA